ncbi:MAG TPA: outer membrane protein transport protein [candidate division Zixibacteria bacterium]|nr:outer membrane protein transport protein [candidate division Zixibacteria bacterium]
MGIGRALVLLLAVFTLLCPAVFASGFGVVGVGGEATAMGGAFRAVADNWTAAFYNPAGLAGIQDNSLGGDYILVNWRNSVTPNYLWGGTYESGIINDVEAYNRYDVFGNGGGGLIFRLPVFGETVFGLTVFQEFDYNVCWELYKPNRSYNSTMNPPQNQFENNFDVVSFQATAAHEFADEKLWLGLGLELLRGDLLISTIGFRDNPYLEVDPEFTGADRPYDKIVDWNQNDGDGYGFGIRLGALWHATDKFRVGFSAHVPSKITLKGDAVTHYYLPELYEPVDPGGSPENLMTAGGTVTDSADFETDINMPATLGAGLSYDVNEKLTVAADIEYTMWSNFEGFTYVYSNHRGLSGAADTTSYLNEFFTSNLAYVVDWENTVKIMCGARYRMIEKLSLLGGVSFDQSPARDNMLQTPLAIDLGNKLGLYGGLQLHLDRWDLTFSTAYVNQPDDDDTDMVDLDNDGMPDSFPGSYTAETYQSTFSFNYRF